jgi:putative sigma-54 modulation protein
VKTTVKARNLELSERLKGQIERKMRRLNRISHPESEANVELITNASHSNDEANVAEVTLLLNGDLLRSSASGPTPIAAVDGVIDKLERQIVRRKERPRSVKVRSNDETEAVLMRTAAGSGAEDSEPENGEETMDGRPSVVKLKRFDMEPMFDEDAIARMEELGHAFFVFLNAETDGICVVYRRRGGDYGIIEPVVGAPARSTR